MGRMWALSIAAAVTLLQSGVGHAQITRTRIGAPSPTCREAYRAADGWRVELDGPFHRDDLIGCDNDGRNCLGIGRQTGSLYTVYSDTGGSSGFQCANEVFYFEIRHSQSPRWVTYFTDATSLISLTGHVLVAAAGSGVEAADGAVRAVAGVLGLGGYFTNLVANDPPDPNYDTVYEPPVRTLHVEWGLTAASNGYFDETILTLLRTRDSLEGLLASNERFLGALEAGDGDMASLQEEASFRFQADREQHANDVSRLIDRLPDVLRSEGIADLDVDQAGIDASLRDIQEHGLPPELATILVEVTGDPAAPNQLLSLLASQSPVIDVPTTVFSVVHQFAMAIKVTACDNGRDDDGDGLSDYPDDPGCSSGAAPTESSQCDNGIDDDGNGLTDFDDWKCTPEWPYWEKAPCGLGGELVLVLPLLGWLNSRRRALSSPDKFRGR